MGRNAAGLVEFQRLRVDSGEAGFWMGRQFGISYEFSITARTVIRFANTVDTLLYSASIHIDAGDLRYRVFGSPDDSIETVAFNTTITPVPLNTMTFNPGYAATTTVMTGGDIDETGLVPFPVARVRAADNSNFRQTSGVNSGSTRGFGPAFAYVVMELLDATTTTGVVDYRFEERDFGY